MSQVRSQFPVSRTTTQRLIPTQPAAYQNSAMNPNSLQCSRNLIFEKGAITCLWCSGTVQNVGHLCFERPTPQKMKKQKQNKYQSMTLAPKSRSELWKHGFVELLHP